MSPTPSVISARSTRSEDDEDDLTIWGRLIVRKLRKYTDKRLQEDVQNYIHVLVTDAERGEWRKPASLTVNPNSPHLADNKTPERLPHITHIIRCETENTDFSYTWQASRPNLTTGQHNSHIYLNYNQFGGGAGGVGSDTQVDNNAQQPTCSHRTYTQLQ